MLKEHIMPDGSASQPPVSGWFMVTFLLVVFSIYAALFSPLLATIAVKLGQISAAGEKAMDLGNILAPGAFAALVSGPIFGALSDRTKSRFGRRKLWIVVGCIFMFAGLVAMALSGSLSALGLGWLAVQIGANASMAAVNALLPDLVPEHQRGRVSALMGIALSLGLLAGPYITQYTTHDNLLMFLAPWALCPVAILMLFTAFKDRPADPMPAFTRTDLIRTFWVNPRQHPDFGWAFLSRFLVFMGVAYFLTYQFIFLSDQLKMNEAEALKGLALSQLLTTAVTIAFTLLIGWLSDRIGRRKPVVIAAGLMVAIGLSTIALATTFDQFLVGAAIYGIGQGVYFAVDMALVAAVLPNPDDTAKDLGVFNIASALPQSLAPVIAPIFLAIGATESGNLPALFWAGTAFAILSAVAILPIRKTR
jgi:MFS family permease